MLFPKVDVTSDSSVLDVNDLAPVLEAAIQLWEDSGLLSAEQFASFKSVTNSVADLEGDILAQANGNSIVLDINAAGLGWFVDTTPLDNDEFTTSSDSTLLTALEGSEAAGRIDLLSVLLHELGYVTGLDHDGGVAELATLMGGELAPGARFILPYFPFEPLTERPPLILPPPPDLMPLSSRGNKK